MDVDVVADASRANDGPSRSTVTPARLRAAPPATAACVAGKPAAADPPGAADAPRAISEFRYSQATLAQLSVSATCAGIRVPSMYIDQDKIY